MSKKAVTLGLLVGIKQKTQNKNSLYQQHINWRVQIELNLIDFNHSDIIEQGF